MLPSADRSPLPGGPDDHTRVVPRATGLDDRTTLVPVVRRPSRLRTLLPWAGFGVVAVVVVAATSAWAASLRGPEDPLLSTATPARVVVPLVPTVAVLPAAAPVGEAGPETTVPAAAARKPARATLAPVVPPKAAAVAPTTAAKATSAAAATKPAAAAVVTPTKEPAAIRPTASSSCLSLFCSSPTGANNRAPAADPAEQ